MVEDTATDLMYLPLAADGLTRLSSSMTARKLTSSCSPAEGGLADRDLDHAPGAGVGPVLDPAALELGDRPADVGRHRSRLRVGHQAAGAELATEPADLAHQVGRGDGHVEVHEPAVDPGHQVVGAHHVGARGSGRLGGLAGGEDRDAHLLAGAGRQGDGAPAPPGRPGGGRRRVGRRARRSRRTWRWPGSGPGPAPRLARGPGCGRAARAASMYFFPCFGITASLSLSGPG